MDDKQALMVIAKDLLVAAMQSKNIGHFSARDNADSVAKMGELHAALTKILAETLKSLE